jgi:hypothetical protein
VESASITNAIAPTPAVDAAGIVLVTNTPVLTMPPTYKSPPTPTPPLTTNAPVVVDVAAVKFDTLNVVTVLALTPLPLGLASIHDESKYI